MSEKFNELVKAYAEAKIDFPQLKEVTVAQWLLESGKGTSKLATEHLNFGGLKWRPEMKNHAKPVDYQAHDGLDKYCKFDSVEKFIKGYWRFLDRSPYEGWRNNVNSAEDFIRFIGPIYAGDPNYVSKVLGLLDEAGELLAEVEHEDHHAGTSEPVSKPPIKEFIESPNQSSREGAKIDMVVAHYTTAGSFGSTKNHFLNTNSEVSAHYIIDKNGDIYQMVKDAHKAWHARHMNQRSIGIEHVAKTGEELTAQQEKSSISLIKWLIAEYKIPVENIIAHKEVIATDCPGNIFGDKLKDKELPKFKKWVADNFSTEVKKDAGSIGPSGLGLYVVQPGDTFSTIADHHNLTMKKLKSFNPEIFDFNIIFPGQRIIIARVKGDDEFIATASGALNLPIEIAEFQLNTSNYQHFSHPMLGSIKVTGGFMEPSGHSYKRYSTKAIFLNGKMKTVRPGKYNIGIDYVVSDRKAKAWYGGTVTRRGREGGYGRRIHIQLDATYKFEGKSYQVYQAFAHLQQMLVSVGQKVSQGEQIGIMGGSGSSSDNAYPPHVDLTTYIFINGKIIQLNPQALDNQLSQ